MIRLIRILGLLLPLQLFAQPEQTQQLPLNTGWNLISIQVGSPAGFSVTAVRNSLFSATDQPIDALVSIWHFDNTARSWTSFQAAVPGYPHDLAVISPGKGYWIHVNTACILKLTGRTWQDPLNLAPGWNLVGFPGLKVDSAGESLTALFRDQLANVQQIWGFDSNPAFRRYVGFDTTARPQILELASLRPGQAYWIYALEPVTLLSEPLIALPGDIDLPPLATTIPRAPGDEDIAAGTDLNGNGILDDAFTQDTLNFPVGISTRLVSIINDGLGRIDWSASENIPWLSFATGNSTIAAAPLDPDLISAQVGRSEQKGTNFVFGSVASEPAHLTVQVDRSGLAPGTYSGSFFVWAGNAQKEIHVLVTVPTVDGDWRGFAATRRVNGKELSIGKVDLHLAIFRKTAESAESDLRAVIDRERSLLFPRDVFMDGAFFSDNEFFLTTSFEVPAGDRNAPPFSNFKHGQDAFLPTFGDIDSNDDGKLDNANPFPFPVRREVTLLGRRLNENRLAGTFVESIQNVLPGDQKIYIEGEFELERLSLAPTLTSVFNRNVLTNQAIGGSLFTATNGFQVTNSFEVQGVRVVVDLEFSGGQNVALTLIGPNGQRTNLFTGAGFSGSKSFELGDAFKSLQGTGTWALEVDWENNGERGQFRGWTLNLLGISSFNAIGRVVTVENAVTLPVAGAHVLLSGNNRVEQRLTDAAGAFIFTNLTENDFTLFVSKPGFQIATKRFFLVNRNLDLGDVLIAPVIEPFSSLAAAPPYGGQPLHVQFTPLLTVADLAAVGGGRSASWNFGGIATSNYVGDAILPRSFTFTNAGYYTNILTVTGSSSQRRLTNHVLVLPQKPLPGFGTNLWSVSFVGAAASGAYTASGFTTNATIITNGVSRTFVTRTGANYEESKRDVAAFDIDRFPYRPAVGGTNPFPGLEDTDTGAGPPTLVNGVNILPPADGAYTVYTNDVEFGITKTNRFRMVSTYGGYVFGTAPARVTADDGSGNRINFTLQIGRIEP